MKRTSCGGRLFGAAPLRMRCIRILFAGILLSVACGKALPEEGTGERDGYRLVWEDGFNEEELDAGRWTCAEDGWGGGNAELQYYRPANVSVGRDPSDGRGCLILTARRESCGGKAFVSGKVHSKGKFSFTYGKIEASIRLPQTADGLWPAFWLLGADIDTDPWPGCGEIDIMEMGHADGIAASTQDRLFNGAAHWGLMDESGHPQSAGFRTAPYSLQDGTYHLFTMFWDADSIRMYLDLDRFPGAEPYFTMDISGDADPETGGSFHHDFYVIFNLAVGGTYTGLFDPSQISALAGDAAARMYVDFVKVYQKKAS